MTALVAYRNLWRAANIAFQGDAPVLAAARQQIRDNFREKSTLPANDPTIQPMIQKAEEVAKFLRHNLVQGQAQGNDSFKLRIHKDTERGDNDSIKTAGQGKASGGCCQG
ncbi:Mitochondrial zinc maintenance protein 1 like [Verticillium longisporum]|uniref:Mitochondrial zinc maintenance protein 1, mitochondrial n=1 Tax=Verticillium longisporum TaxID=100787 RepID=A0A8I2ZJV2_VERLO|nr:Mitochondrial zinc maintenance protein 1 like [Verticillium longisporum]